MSQTSLKSEPITFSTAFGRTSKAVEAAGAVDVALNCDTRLFVDPLLIRESGHEVFRECASQTYVARFNQVIKLLVASKASGDKAWDAARRILSFPEMPYTHLGYSHGKPGSGFGSILTDSLLDSAKQVIDLGVTDPDIFVALALFEENVGADRISDMTCHIILECLVEFTQMVCDRLALPTRKVEIPELGGRSVMLPVSPLDGSAVVLVPHDVVRDLPVASDWDSVASAASETQAIRDRVNADIGNIWAARTRADKAAIRNTLIRSKAAFDLFLEVFRSAADAPYDISADHNGELYPADIRHAIAAHYPLDLTRYAGRTLDANDANEVVERIIGQFQLMIETNGAWQLLWNEGRATPRREKAAQLLFFAVANAYCEANNIDMSPEADAGCGPVDFKFSQGREHKILVEIKKSTNTSLCSGYSSQLEIYRDAERTSRAHYVVVDLGGLTTEKRARLAAAHDAAALTPRGASRIWFIDASVRESASKRRT